MSIATYRVEGVRIFSAVSARSHLLSSFAMPWVKSIELIQGVSFGLTSLDSMSVKASGQTSVLNGRVGSQFGLGIENSAESITSSISCVMAFENSILGGTGRKSLTARLGLIES
jgi:hypothetical protein